MDTFTKGALRGFAVWRCFFSEKWECVFGGKALFQAGV